MRKFKKNKSNELTPTERKTVITGKTIMEILLIVGLIIGLWIILFGVFIRDWKI